MPPCRNPGAVTVITAPLTSSCFEPSGGSGMRKNSSAVISLCATADIRWPSKNPTSWNLTAPHSIHERELVRQQQHLHVLLPRRQLRFGRRLRAADEPQPEFDLVRLRLSAVEQAVQGVDPQFVRRNARDLRPRGERFHLLQRERA